MPRVKNAIIARPPMTPPMIAPVSGGREDSVELDVPEFCEEVVLERELDAPIADFEDVVIDVVVDEYNELDADALVLTGVDKVVGTAAAAAGEEVDSTACVCGVGTANKCSGTAFAPQAI